MTNEERAIKKILDAVSDIRLDSYYLGFYLAQALGPSKQKLDEVLSEAGYVHKDWLSEVTEGSETLSESTEAEPVEEEDTSTLEIEELSEVGKWAPVVARWVQGGTVSKREFAEALIELTSTLFSHHDAYGEREALTARVIWIWESGYTLWADSESTVFFSHLTNELSEDVFPLDGNWLNSDWEWCAFSNGWRYLGQYEIHRVIDKLEKELDDAVMVLPWEDFAEQAIDLGIEETLQNLGIEVENPTATAAYEYLWAFLESLQEDSIEIPDGIWELETVMGDDLMPLYSGVGRFNSFIAALEDEYNWIVIYDECCGACSRGSIDDARTEPGKEDSPVFITWAQNAQLSWLTNGDISHSEYLESDHVADLVKCAEAHGLTVEVDDSKTGSNDGYKWVNITY